MPLRGQRGEQVIVMLEEKIWKNMVQRVDLIGRYYKLGELSEGHVDF